MVKLDIWEQTVRNKSDGLILKNKYLINMLSCYQNLTVLFIRWMELKSIFSHVTSSQVIVLLLFKISNVLAKWLFLLLCWMSKKVNIWRIIVSELMEMIIFILFSKKLFICSLRLSFRIWKLSSKAWINKELRRFRN